jgi:hypothetical protein
MVRPPRPTTLHWLLWLVIALLPLRGWAMAQMATAPVVVAQHTTDAQPPCHGEAGTDSPAAVTHAGCSLCELCHASLGMPAVTALPMPTLPHAAPAALPTTGVRDGPPGDLFRPPRRTV